MLRHDKAIAHPIRQKDHLKNVPEYLMPVSMRGVSNVRNKGGRRAKKRKAAGTAGSSSEQRVQQSKKRNPLYGGGGDGDNDGADGGDGGGDGDSGEPAVKASRPSASTSEGNKIYTSNDVLGESSMSGRKQWKLRHKKGAFNPKAAKKNDHRTPGSFIKSKNYKK